MLYLLLLQSNQKFKRKTFIFILLQRMTEHLTKITMDLK